jgi:tetratricopeptide (TPR) repeat protein
MRFVAPSARPFAVGPRAHSARVSLLALFLAACLSRPGQAQELPASLEGIFREGVAAQKAGKLDEAEKAFQKVLRGGGKLAFVYNNLGIVYQQKRQFAQAIAQFREAIRLEPGYTAPRILLGASLLAEGKVSEATHELERAVQLAPDNPLAHRQLAQAYEAGEDYFGTLDQFRILRGLAPSEPEYVYQLGRAYLELSGWCYQQIAKLNPQSARIPQIKAEIYSAQGHPEAALRSYQRALEADPTLPGLHLARAQIYLRLGKSAEARSEVERELALMPDSTAAKALKQKLEAGGSGAP